jgi:hypothetical protein
MRYGVSMSKDYLSSECVVIRDFLSVPKGRVLAVIVRENKYEAEQAAQEIVDLLNNKHSQQS